MIILLCLPLCIHDLQRRRLGFQVPRHTIDLEVNGEGKAPKLLYLLDMQSDFSGLSKVQATSPKGSTYFNSMKNWIIFLNVCNCILFLGSPMTILGTEAVQVKTGVIFREHDKKQHWGQKKKISQNVSLFLIPRRMFPWISSAQNTSLTHTEKEQSRRNSKKLLPGCGGRCWNTYSHVANSHSDLARLVWHKTPTEEGGKKKKKSRQTHQAPYSMCFISGDISSSFASLNEEALDFFTWAELGVVRHTQRRLCLCTRSWRKGAVANLCFCLLSNS